jgi:hypothetical protein
LKCFEKSLNLKFEKELDFKSLKNEFEKIFLKKTKPHPPLSLSPFPAQPPLLSSLSAQQQRGPPSSLFFFSPGHLFLLNPQA